MQRSKILAVTFVFLLLAALPTGCAKSDSNVPAQIPIEPRIVTFPDKNLETVIREALGKPSGGEILSTELAQLTELRIQYRGVSDLTGLEYCTNLTFLDIRGEPVTDISPLFALTNLTHLALVDNHQISDLSPLSNLFKLEWLAIEVTPLEDISPLSNLINLKILGLAGNQIRDISPLVKLTRLTSLCLQDNEISDISVLSHLRNLTDLRLTQNQVDDISPLVKNSGLGEGDSVLLGGNHLELYEGSEDMENIKTLEKRGVIVSLDPHQWAPEKVPPGAPVPQPPGAEVPIPQ